MPPAAQGLESDLMELFPEADDPREVATSADVEADAEFVLDLADAAAEEALNS